MNASVVAGPADPVAWNDTGDPGTPLALASRRTGPATVPRVRVVCAYPVESVTALEGDGVAPPVAVKATATPGTGLLHESTTATTHAAESGLPTVPFWPS